MAASNQEQEAKAKAEAEAKAKAKAEAAQASPKKKRQARDGDTITVRSTLKPKPDGGHPVALREVHGLHPDGEVFIAGPNPVEVALTAEVKAKLRDGVLEEV